MTGSATRALSTFLDDLTAATPDVQWALDRADRVSALHDDMLADRARWDAEDAARLDTAA